VAEVTKTNAIAKPTSLGQQVWLVVGLRWRTFRNGLRSKSETMHLVGTVVMGLAFTFVTLGVGAAIGIGSYKLVSLNRFEFLIAILWGIFLFWQFVPVLTSQMNPGFDGRNLLRFPLRFSAFFLMNVAYGFADPAALSGIFWHLAMGIGITLARPSLWPWVVLALGISAAINLIFNRMLFAWIERFLARRRTREILGALFILIAISFQFVGPAIQRWGGPIQRAITDSAVLWRVLPPGEAGVALEQAASGDSTGALETIGLLCVYATLFAGLFATRVHAQFTGEDLGESAAPAPALRRPAKMREAASGTVAAAAEQRASATDNFGTRLFGGPVAAIYVKEFHYLVRNTIMLMNVFMPLLLIAVFSLNLGMGGTRHGGRPPAFFNFASSQLIYPVSVAYIFLLVMNFCPNNLAYDGRGVERLFMSPVKFRDVMLAKNLFHSSVILLEVLLALGMVVALGHVPSLPILLATWAALPFAACVHFMVGNWLSLQYPRKFEFGIRRQRPSGFSMLMSFALFFVMNGMLSISALLCLWLANLWVLAAVYAGLSLASVTVYRATLESTSQQALRQRDMLLDQLAR
jgi:ABC-2 type transport system permease protein